jgi:hypothetical protein
VDEILKAQKEEISGLLFERPAAAWLSIAWLGFVSGEVEHSHTISPFQQRLRARNF